MSRQGVELLLLTSLANIRYLTGFSGSNANLVIGVKGSWLFTDSRYTEQAKVELKASGCRVRLKIVKSFYPEVAAITGTMKAGKLAFEKSHVSYAAFIELRRALKGIKLKAVAGVVEQLRSQKDLSEVASIKSAIKVARNGFQRLARARFTGKTEKDLALELETSFKKSGADGFSFETIVTSGARSALPHGMPSSKAIRSGDFVIVDGGVDLNGYKSDQTRTFVVSKASRRHKEIYQVVKDAHDIAIEMACVGVSSGKVDLAARKIIKAAGFGKYFGHGTGHGVGLEVHEAPSVGPKSKDILKEGMVITVEPGIYVPGFGGVRIEDMVLITKDCPEVLTDGDVKLRVVK